LKSVSVIVPYEVSNSKLGPCNIVGSISSAPGPDKSILSTIESDNCSTTQACVFSLISSGNGSYNRTTKSFLSSQSF
jgi:hypothetical protein